LPVATRKSVPVEEVPRPTEPSTSVQRILKYGLGMSTYEVRRTERTSQK
jgi:hypothetical protein